MAPRRPAISTQPSFTSDSGAGAGAPRPPLPPNHQYHQHHPPPVSQPPLLQAPTSAPQLPPPLLNGQGGMVQTGPGYGGPAHLANGQAGGAGGAGAGGGGPVGIGPNHLQHPQHQQWVQVQQQRQDEMRMMEMQAQGQGQGQGQRGPPGQVGGPAGQVGVGMRAPLRGDPRSQHDLAYSPVPGQQQQQQQLQPAYLNSNQYSLGPQPSSSIPSGVPHQPHLRAGSAGGYLSSPGPAPGAPLGPGPLGLNQQRPIPISRNSVSSQAGLQQFGQSVSTQSPVQGGPGSYRVLSQAGSAQGRASPASGPPRSIPGSASGLQDAMRTPQQMQQGAHERELGQAHPAVLGASLAASGASPLSAIMSPVGPALAKLSAYHDALSNAFCRPKDQILESVGWVVSEFFTPHAVLKYTLYDPATAAVKKFEVPCTAFPRMNYISSHCGAIGQATRANRVREYLLSAIDPPTRQPAHVGFLLEADDVSWTTKYQVGSHVELNGRLTVHFVVAGPGPGLNAVALRIESLHFESSGREQFVSREAIVHERVERLVETGGGLDAAVKRKRDEEQDARDEKEGSGKKGKRGSIGTRRKSQLAEEEEQEKRRRDGWETERWDGLEGIAYDRLRIEDSEVGAFGLPEMGMRCLEIAESVAQLQDLITYSIDHHLGPIQSLEQYVDGWRTQQQHAYPSVHPNPMFYSTGGFPQRGPPNGGIVGSPTPLSASANGHNGVAPSPMAQPPLQGQGAKRKATGPLPPRTPTPGQALGDVSMLGEDGEEGAGSPAGAKGGAAGRGRGRGRGQRGAS